MNTKRKATTVAVAGTAAGALGLGLLAMPAGAEDAPELPEIGAERLVGSVLDSEPPALSGTAEIDDSIGLPAVPGMPALDAQSARVHYDGAGKGRVSLQQDGSELTYVLGDDALWSYDSAEGAATRTPLPDKARKSHGQDGTGADPAQAATEVVERLKESSEVTVDGTARVAGRAAYELVLTPKPGERTLLREVRIAVDAEKRLPLRLSVLTHGTTDPAFEIGFSDIDFGPQPERLFEFSPPEGTDVTERDGKTADRPHGGTRGSGDTEQNVDVVGDGWDTVVLARAPQEALDRASGSDNGGDNDNGGDGNNTGGMDVGALLDLVGKPVQGEFGSGHVIETRVGTVLVTEDGRVAAGAVPEQVLRQALENR